METVKILVLESLIGDGVSYGKGGIYDAPQALAKELVRAGHAEYVGENKVESREKKIGDKYQKRNK